MSDQIEALHRLQEVETQLASIRRKIESKERRVEAQERRVRVADEKLAQQLRAIQEKQASLDALSLEVSSREAEIARQREALNQARTNKVYAEILAAMNTTKADNSRLESGILQLMEEIQSLKSESEAIEAEKAELRKGVEAAKAQLEQVKADCKDDLERLEAEREQCAEHIHAPSLALFTRVAERHEGEAMVPVVKLHPKRDEYACTGCNMKVTLEVVNALQMRDELQLCGSCGRVLYMENAPVGK